MTIRTRFGPLLLAAALVGTILPAHAGTAKIASAISANVVDVAGDGLWTLPAQGWPDPGPIDGEAWILVDVGTGQVLGSRRATEPRPPASTTKLLTALAVARRVPGSQVAVVSEAAAAQVGASTGLRAGDQVRVDDLLALLLLRSGNDAAVVLAEHTAGSVEAFAGLLEQEARVLGLEGFVLQEPHGLDDLNRLSARQLAVVGRAVLADDRLRPLVGASTWTLTTGQTIESRNELLTQVAGATGLKTGMTTAAGWSLVASARRGPRHLVAVVLGGTSASSRFGDAARLLEFGFAAFDPPPAFPPLRLRGDAAWLDIQAGVPEAMLPVGTAVRLVPTLPVELREPRVTWSWDTAAGAGSWSHDGRLRTSAGQFQRSPVSWSPPSVASARSTSSAGSGVLGAWVSGRVQAGLRAATVSGLWGD